MFSYWYKSKLVKIPLNEPCSAACGCLDGEHDEYKVVTWDTAGQPMYSSSMQPTYLENHQIILFVYDITDKDTLEDLDKYLKFTKENNVNDQVHVLVGNKSDLCEEIDESGDASEQPRREVPFECGLKYAMKNGMTFYEASAKSGFNVSKIFEAAIIEKIERMNHSWK